MPNADGATPVVDAEIELANGRRVSARMTELNERSITVSSSDRALQSLDGGDRVGLSIRSTALAGAVQARAHVDRVIVDGQATRVTLHFAEEAQFQALLDAGIGSVFNRRFAFRVQPADGEPVGLTVHPSVDAPIDVTVEADHGRPELRGAAEDISVTGVGFIVTDGSAAQLTIGARIVMVMELPPARDRVRVSGRVRYLAEVSGGERIGADFERGTPLFEPAVDLITAYVMRRQRELIRTKQSAR
ncbi:MAG: PilZ domain-containing protein [Myxococcota bacterium]